jgi:hypothetical protein
MGDWRQAVHYRNRAELFRIVAEETDYADHRESLQRVAKHYDVMADLLEREARGVLHTASRVAAQTGLGPLP